MLHPCRWGPCPHTFATQAQLVQHMKSFHFTPARLDAECGFRRGKFHEWLKLTGRDGGTQSSSGASFAVTCMRVVK